MKNTTVYQESRNNFTDADQAIDGRQIMTAVIGPYDPTTEPGAIQPRRQGEVFFQIRETAEDHQLHAWVAVAQTAGSAVWEPLGGSGSATNVALLDRANNFTNQDQTIDGDRIVAFYNGGSNTPEQTGARPDYDGQFYISFITKEDGTKDVAVWIGNGNTWVPIAVDVSRMANLDVSNNFRNPVQTLGASAHGRKMVGCRVLHNDTPIANANIKATVIGEEVFCVNDGVIPTQYTLYKAIQVNEGQSNTGEWKLFWSSNTAPVDTSRIAYKDEENIFCKGQRIGDDNHSAPVTTAHGGSATPYDRIAPITVGEMYIETYDVASIGYQRKFWVARTAGDARSWQCIYDEAGYTKILSDIVDLRTDLTAESKDIDDLTKTLTSLDTEYRKTVAAVDVVEFDVEELEKWKVLADGAMNSLETRVTALEAKLVRLVSKL